MSNAERQKRYRDRKRNAQAMAGPARNAQAIPGDPDYVGCCKQVDGKWVVDNTKPPVKDMSDDELVRRLHYIKDWQRSPEHEEVLRRRGEQALQAAGACL